MEDTYASVRVGDDSEMRVFVARPSAGIPAARDAWALTTSFLNGVKA